jgi:predicted GIY-YIG superfamily endonuclease
MEAAIVREKQMKEWQRAWKIRFDRVGQSRLERFE